MAAVSLAAKRGSDIVGVQLPMAGMPAHRSQAATLRVAVTVRAGVAAVTAGIFARAAEIVASAEASHSRMLTSRHRRARGGGECLLAHDAAVALFARGYIGRR